MASIPSWSAVIAAVHADPILANANPPLVLQANSPIPAFLGEASKQQKQAPPYVIWYPTTDRYDRDAMPRGPSPVSAQGNVPRYLWTRWVGARCHINCLQAGPSDFDTMELTLNSFIAALHRTAHGAYRITGGQLEPTHGTELMKDRKVYLLDLEVATPVTEVPAESTSVTITAVPVTAGITTPTNPPQ